MLPDSQIRNPSRPVLVERHALLVFALACLFWGGVPGAIIPGPMVLADEIIIDHSRPQPQTIGDFDCSPGMDVGINCFKLQPHEGILLEDGCSECSISAGDLWQHLKAQGIDSTEQLVFLVDFGNAGSHNPLKLEALEFTILDSGNNQLTKMLLDKNGDNQLLIPGMDGFNLRPEAQMKVELGYDFMSRFNANSTELVAFRSRVSGAGEHAPQFIVPGTQRSFGRTNFLIMFGFIGFWCMLFWALRRTTLPKNNSDPKNNSRKLVLSNTKDKSVSSGAV